MDKSPLEHHEHAEHAEHAAHSGDPFIIRVSVTIAILAVIAAGISSLENVEAAGALARLSEANLSQNKATDTWSYYQAQRIKKTIYDVLALQAPEKANEAAQQSKRYDEESKKLESEARKLETEVDGAEEESRVREHRHHRLTLAATFLHVGIAVSTIAIIARGQRWPWYLALLLASRASAWPEQPTPCIERGACSFATIVKSRHRAQAGDTFQGVEPGPARNRETEDDDRRADPLARMSGFVKQQGRDHDAHRRHGGDAERGGRRPETMNELHIGEKRHEGEEPALEYRFADCHVQVVPRDVRGREGEPERQGRNPVAPIAATQHRGSRFHLRAKTLKHPHKRPITPNRASPPSACASNCAPAARAKRRRPTRMTPTPMRRVGVGHAPSTSPATRNVQTIEEEGANKVLWLAGIMAVAEVNSAP